MIYLIHNSIIVISVETCGLMSLSKFAQLILFCLYVFEGGVGIPLTGLKPLTFLWIF